MRDVLVLAGGTGEEDPALLLALVADDVAMTAAEQQADLEQKKSFHKHYLITREGLFSCVCPVVNSEMVSSILSHHYHD